MCITSFFGLVINQDWPMKYHNFILKRNWSLFHHYYHHHHSDKMDYLCALATYILCDEGEYVYDDDDEGEILKEGQSSLENITETVYTMKRYKTVCFYSFIFFSLVISQQPLPRQRLKKKRKTVIMKICCGKFGKLLPTGWNLLFRLWFLSQSLLGPQFLVSRVFLTLNKVY